MTVRMGSHFVAVKDSTAARMLDMTTTEFRHLVHVGALPKSFQIGDKERWRVEEIEAIIGGKAALPSEDFEL